jgi:curli biogenesis system outer membrane secretion channel CsgG
MNNPLTKSVLPLILFGLWIFSGCAVQTAMPTAPQPPRFRTLSIEEMIVSKPTVDKFSEEKDFPSFMKNILGLNEFSNQGGSMVTDMIALKLLAKRQLRMVDREHIEKVVRELERTASGVLKMSEADRLKKIGELAGADFLLFGSVTEFNTTNMQITQGRIFEPGEEDRYKKDYDEFTEKADAYDATLTGNMQAMAVGSAFTMGLSGIGMHETQAQRTKFAAMRAKVQPLETYKRDLAGSNQTVATVANVGLTAKLIRVATGKVVWVYQGSKRDIDLRKGMTTLVDDMLESLLQNSGVK